MSKTDTAAPTSAPETVQVLTEDWIWIFSPEPEKVGETAPGSQGVRELRGNEAREYLTALNGESK